jgi:hypothetical protein
MLVLVLVLKEFVEGLETRRAQQVVNRKRP